MKNCPFCGEQIQADAIMCEHCGKYMDQGPRLATDMAELMRSRDPAGYVRHQRKQMQRQAMNWIVIAVVSVVVLFCLCYAALDFFGI